MSGRSRATRAANPAKEDARVSRHPLEFEEALETLLNTPPDDTEDGEPDAD